VTHTFACPVVEGLKIFFRLGHARPEGRGFSPRKEFTFFGLFFFARVFAWIRVINTLVGSEGWEGRSRLWENAVFKWLWMVFGYSEGGSKFLLQNRGRGAKKPPGEKKKKMLRMGSRGGAGGGREGKEGGGGAGKKEKKTNYGARFFYFFYFFFFLK
jgi:hypothetical protein